MIGLLMNMVGPIADGSRIVLGDFTGLIFWLLAILNMIAYLVPTGRSLTVNALLLALRGAGLCFVLYFCAVFLLYLPLALLLIAALGLGLLLLIPYFALAVQWFTLRDDYLVWSNYSSRRAFLVTVAAGFLLLPASLAAHLMIDRARLLNAVDYVQHPLIALNHNPEIDGSGLERLLQEPRRRPRGWREHKSSIPLYGALYHRFVFDGVGLSEGMRQRLRRVFFGNEGASTAVQSRISGARVGTITPSTVQDNNVTHTNLRVRLENPDLRREVELDIQIQLPENAFLTGQWLVIGESHHRTTS